MASRIAPLAALCATFAVVVVASSSVASAQVIYEPVQYQYTASQHYYYGGSDPYVHKVAAEPVGGAGRWGRVNGYAFASGNIDTHREVVHERVRVFTDALPYVNAYIYGFTPTDARNEAYFNVPRYFRKGDLLNAAVLVDGAFVVPAQAHPIRIDRDGDGRELRTRGTTTMPRPMMIIPKDQLRKKQSDKTFASLKQ